MRCRPEVAPEVLRSAQLTENAPDFSFVLNQYRSARFHLPLNIVCFTFIYLFISFTGTIARRTVPRNLSDGNRKCHNLGFPVIKVRDFSSIQFSAENVSGHNSF